MKSKMIQDHIEKLKSFKGKQVEAGWFESNLYPSGASVAKVARLQELGGVTMLKGQTRRIPPRPFMRYAWLLFARDRKNIERRIFNRFMRGKISSDEILFMIGKAIENKIAESIKKGEWTPNAPYTIAKKGFDKPLIDTAQMFQTIDSTIIG